jgi:hypothetical protein
MVKLSTTFKEAKRYGLLFFCLICGVILFKNELKLLFLPDPPVEKLYQQSFRDMSLPGADEIIAHDGFTMGKQGLQLLPGSSGSMTFSFGKEEQQGCLLRVWFYGDRGTGRPNTIKLSLDAGRTFRQVTGSGNYIGSVFNLTPYVMGSRNFHLVFEAANHAPFSSAVLDRVEVVITRGHQAQPPLPSRALLFTFLLALLIPVVFSRHASRREKVVRVVFVLIIMLAAYLRWNEVVRVSGTHIGGDAKGYLEYAQKMELFSDNGFYSAQFEKREPLYIFIVKLFFLVFGVSGTHLRFVSFVFSLVTIYLTYKIGKEWFNEIIGLTAAFILAVHPYLITLSARGLRAEWFTSLILLFIYYGYVKESMAPRWRSLITGLLIGALLLSRSESLFMIIIFMAIYPLVARSRWNYSMALFALLLGVALFMPHLKGVYQKHGDPFYTMNKYARFYANSEFMDTPGFPTRGEIREKGMYTGPAITPVDYYLKLHSPWQLIKYTVVGFAKINFTMPLTFAMGRGNRCTITYAVKALEKNHGRAQLLETASIFISILKKDFWQYCIAGAVLVSVMSGLILMAVSHFWIMFLFLLLLQVQTSFLAYLGIDTRLCVQSYPLIALCCGYAIWRVGSGARMRFGRLETSTTVSSS